MLLPRFLVLEVLLFFHFLQQSHAALTCFTVQRELSHSNGTSLSKEEKGPRHHHRAVPLDVIIKTDRVTRSTVTISVKPSSVADGGVVALNSRDGRRHANEELPFRCSSKYYPQNKPSFHGAFGSTNPLGQSLSKSTAKSCPSHDRGLLWHQGGDNKKLWLNNLLHSPETDGRKTDDSAVLIVSRPVQRLLFAPKYF